MVNYKGLALSGVIFFTTASTFLILLFWIIVPPFLRIEKACTTDETQICYRINIPLMLGTAIGISLGFTATLTGLAIRTQDKLAEETKK